MKKKSFTITLDGPAASGKSTLGERLAESWGFLYVDTGGLYRGVKLAGLNKNFFLNV
jgi:cytidylate kinase